MQEPDSQETANTPGALTCSVPEERIVSVEHQCIVKNFSNGFKSLGGEHQLKRVLQHGGPKSNHHSKAQTEPVAGVSLRPNDPYAKKISSTKTTSQNVLLKVTLPKRTGRKRKRGSDDPFEEPPLRTNPSDNITAPELLRQLRDNPGNYRVEAIGMIRDTHSFNDLPDFQIRPEEIPIMREIRSHGLPPDFEKLKTFDGHLLSGANAVTLFPAPPTFIFAGQSNNYPHQRTMPRQPENGSGSVPNAPRSYGLRQKGTVLGVDQEAPTGPPSDLPELKGELTPQAIKVLKELLNERPIVSKRAFHKMRPGYTTHTLNEAVSYVGYFVTAGPWRDTIIQYGNDPRQKPEHRIYQTIRLSRKGIRSDGDQSAHREKKEKDHIFDGRTVTGPGNDWQLCDVTDPTLQHMISTEELRNECELEQCGWYYNGSLAKIRVIMRDKMLRLANNEPLLEESDYVAVAALPKMINEAADCDLTVLPDKPDVRNLGLAVIREAGINRRAETRVEADDQGEDQEDGATDMNRDLDLRAIDDDDFVDDEEPGGDGLQLNGEDVEENNLENDGEFVEDEE